MLPLFDVVYPEEPIPVTVPSTDIWPIVGVAVAVVAIAAAVILLINKKKK